LRTQENCQKGNWRIKTKATASPWEKENARQNRFGEGEPSPSSKAYKGKGDQLASTRAKHWCRAMPTCRRVIREGTQKENQKQSSDLGKENRPGSPGEPHLTYLKMSEDFVNSWPITQMKHQKKQGADSALKKSRQKKAEKGKNIRRMVPSGKKKLV